MIFTVDSFRRRISEQLPRRSETGTVKAVQPGAPPSAVIDLSSLYEIHDSELFLREAYRLILEREADVYGFVRFREMLRNYVPREVIIHHLVHSEEARGKERRFSGMRSLAGASGNLRYGLGQRLQSIAPSILLRLRKIVEIVMQGWRFEFIDVKMDSIKHDLTAASAEHFRRTEERFYQLSEKLDTYVSDLQSRLAAVGVREGQNETLNGTYPQLSHLPVIVDHLADLRADLASFKGAIETRMGNLEALAVKFPEQRTAIVESVRTLGSQLAEHQQEAVRHRGTLEGSLTTLHEAVEARLQPAVVHGGENVIVTQVDGFIVGVPGEEWRVAAYHVFRGAQEPGLARAFREAIQPGMVVVDVGANIGMYTLYAARQTGSTGKVISFEPGPRPFKILKDNIQVNGFLETGIIDFRQVAVSDRAGTATLTVYPDNSGHSTLFDESASGQKIEVVTQRLDDALADQARVDVIKVDAEGAEPFVLRGMQNVLRSNPHLRLFIEFAPQLLQRAGVDPAAFLDELAEMGLHIRLVDDLSGELRHITTSDLLRCYSTNLGLSREPGNAF